MSDKRPILALPKPPFLTELLERSLLANHSDKRFWLWPKGQQVLERYLKTYCTIHTSAFHVEPGDKWHSNEPLDTELGACSGTTTDFLTNAYTWSNLSTESNCLLTATAALQAASNSVTPMRTVLIAGDWHTLSTKINNHRHPSTRAYCLATLTVEGGDLRVPLPACPSQATPPSECIHVYIIENTLASDFDCPALKNALLDYIDLPHLTYFGKPDGHTPSGIATPNTRRLCMARSPATFWLRDYPTQIPAPGAGPGHRPGRTQRILGIMGILPKGPETFFKMQGYSPIDRIQTDTLNKVKAILREMAWELYLRRKKWSEPP